MAAQDLGDPNKQPAWARLQHELPPALTAWAAAVEQMAAATSAFLVRKRARRPVDHWLFLFSGMGSSVLQADQCNRSVITFTYLLQAASLQCHSQRQAAVKHYDAAVHSTANTADSVSWAAVDRWQDEKRWQQNSAGSDRSTMPAEDEQRLCAAQLQVVQHPMDTGQLVQLVVTALDSGDSAEDVARGCAGSRDSTAAQLQHRLISIEAEAAKTTDGAVEELAAAVENSTAAQCRLLDEHLAAVSTASTSTLMCEP